MADKKKKGKESGKTGRTLAKTGKTLKNEVVSFLADKPLWVWLVVYVLFVAVLFGIFCLIYAMLTVKWWVSIILIILAGVIWGFLAHSNRNSGKKESAKV